MSIEKTEFTFPDEAGDKPQVRSEAPEIEVLDDTPVADRNRKRMIDDPKELTDEELGKYDEGVKKRIQHFTKGYHQERRDKEAAQREKDEAIRIAQAVVEENRQLRGSLSEGQTALLGQARKVIDSEVAEAKRKYKEAADAFDSDAMLAAQEEMLNAKIKADKLENFKPAPLQQSQDAVQTQQRVAQPQQTDEKLSRWQRENSWFGNNKRMTAYALGLHEDLLNEGVPVGSDHYYARLDEDVRARFPENFNGAGADDATPQTRTRSNVVAPATRSTAARKVVLTQTQVSIAKRLGVPLELYARKVAEEMRK